MVDKIAVDDVVQQVDIAGGKGIVDAADKLLVRVGAPPRKQVAPDPGSDHDDHDDETQPRQVAAEGVLRLLQDLRAGNRNA